MSGRQIGRLAALLLIAAAYAFTAFLCVLMAGVACGWFRLIAMPLAVMFAAGAFACVPYAILTYRNA